MRAEGNILRVEEMEGRHRITTSLRLLNRGRGVEEMEGRHRITTGRPGRRRAAQWKRWKEDIESQRLALEGWGLG